MAFDDGHPLLSGISKLRTNGVQGSATRDRLLLRGKCDRGRGRASRYGGGDTFRTGYGCTAIDARDLFGKPVGGPEDIVRIVDVDPWAFLNKLTSFRIGKTRGNGVIVGRLVRRAGRSCESKLVAHFYSVLLSYRSGEGGTFQGHQGVIMVPDPSSRRTIQIRVVFRSVVSQALPRGGDGEE